MDLLLLTASLLSSLSAIVKRFRFGFCHETARKALAANLPNLAPSPTAWSMPSTRSAPASYAWKTDKTNRPIRTSAVVMRRPKEKAKKVYAFGVCGTQ